jgi:hypothetical protein
MELLREGKHQNQDPSTIDKEKMPFWSLPTEMPHHQLKVTTKPTDPSHDERSVEKDTVSGVTNDASLSYAAAVAGLSLLESFFELGAPTFHAQD